MLEYLPVRIFSALYYCHYHYYYFASSLYDIE